MSFKPEEYRMVNIPVKMRGKLASKRAVVDDEDFNALSKFSWREETNGYAVAYDPKSSRKVSYMHRMITNAKSGTIVDHINRNKLDNRKGNLRFCNKSQNAQNGSSHRDTASGLRGAYWFKPHSLWKSQIRVNGKSKHLGYFKSKEEAYDAYKSASKKYQGEFSPFSS